MLVFMIIPHISSWLLWAMKLLLCNESSKSKRSCSILTKLFLRLFKVTATGQMNVREGSTNIVMGTAILRWELQIILVTSPTQSILSPVWSVPTVSQKARCLAGCRKNTSLLGSWYDLTNGCTQTSQTNNVYLTIRLPLRWTCTCTHTDTQAGHQPYTRAEPLQANSLSLTPIHNNAYVQETTWAADLSHPTPLPFLYLPSINPNTLHSIIHSISQPPQ